MKIALFAIPLLLISCKKEIPKEVLRTVQTENLEIDYRFLDKESEDIESQITKVTR